MQNGISSSGVESIGLDIESLPPPPSPIPGLEELQGGSQLAPPPTAKPGSTLERMVTNPLPPTLGNYDIEYGPVSSTEPQLAPATDDGELPRFDEVNEQYDFLRRTLSHSRNRYSARFKRRQPQRSNRASQLESSMDRPGMSRYEGGRDEIETSLDIGQRQEAPPIGETGRSLTYTGQHPLKQRQRQPHQPRSEHGRGGRNRPSTQLEDDEPVFSTVDMSGRREMYNRRYQSLQRSFRSAHQQRRDPTRNFTQNLTPIESVGAISYMPVPTSGDQSRSRRSSAPHGPDEENSVGQNKKKGFFSSFGRRKKSNVPQGSSSMDNDDVIPVVNPDALFSPLSPPLSDGFLDSLSAPPTRSPGERSSPERDVDEGDIMVGRMDMGPEDSRQSPAPRDAAASEASDQPEEQGRNRLSTDLDRAANQRAVQQRTDVRLRRRSRTGSHTQRGGRGGDTDEETDEVSRRHSNQPSQDIHVEAQNQKERSLSPPRAKTKSAKKRAMSKALLTCPALKFIIRKDLYTFLNKAGESGEEFFSNRALMELVQRIRADHSLFEKFQHSKQLVQALNKFVITDTEIPDGWEKKLNKEGRVFFIDHKHKITTFIDPRLPLTGENLPTTVQSSEPVSATSSNSNRRRVYSSRDEFGSPHTTVVHSNSVPGPSEVSREELDASTTNTENNYEGQVVAFFRKPNIVDIISQRYQRGVRPRLREAIEDIQQNGFPALERVQLSGGGAAIELTIILSIFEEDISAIRLQPAPHPPPPPTIVEPLTVSTKSTLQRRKEAFSSKLQTFKLQLARLGFAQGSRLKYNIRRNHLLEDAYEHVMKSDIRQLQRKRLNVTFRGEEGLDYGGPSREFFFLLSREIFNPYYGLFEYSAIDSYTVQINSTSAFIQNNLDWFRFAGRIIGLVIVQGFLLDVFFTRPIYKAILGRAPAVKDIESLDPAFYNSLLWIMENDPSPLDLTFTVEEEAFGQLTTHELKEGGEDLPVLEENKLEYIELMVRWRLDRGVAEQMQSLLKGFTEVMPASLLQSFDAQEVEFIIAGTLEIDVDDWKTHTEYRNGYHANHPVILWFWRAVEMFDNEQRLRLLQFVTGTSSVPYEGFKALRGSSGPKRFCIDFFNDVASLPRSHTCFNRLDLPPYSSFEILFEKLRTAVEEGGGFGIE